MRSIPLALAVLLSAAPLASAIDPPTTRPTHTITVQARTADSHQPVAGVKLSWSTDDNPDGSGETPASGDLPITGLSDQTRYLSLRVKRDGMVPLVVYWQKNADHPTTAPAIPATLPILMEPASRISGHVVDDAGKPVEGAKIVIIVSKKYPGSTQRVDINWKSTTTDSAGLWSYDGVPAKPDHVTLAAYHLAHLTSDSVDTANYEPLAELFDGTAKFTLPAATPVDVTVLKPDGSPAPGASVFFGRNNQVADAFAPAKTDPQGVTHFGFKPGMTGLLTASLPGFGPAQTEFSVQSNPHPLTLKLTPQNPRTLDVVNPGGQPIPSASIRLSSWRGNQVLSANLKTDPAGRALWNDGPPDAVQIALYADGYTGAEHVDWKPNTPTRVVLVPPTNLTARVLDAQTGDPVPSYTIRAGAAWEEGQRVVWQQTDSYLTQNAAKSPGRFTLRFDSPAYRYVLRVAADGYLPEDSAPLAPDGQPKSLEFRLQRGSPVTGKVLSPTSQPVANATVYLVANDEWLSVQNGAVPDYESKMALHVQTAADGRFSLPPQKNDFALLVLSDQGSATLTRHDLTTPDTAIHLAPWAHVRGTIAPSAKPAAGHELYANSDNTTLTDGHPVMGKSYFLSTSKDGSFDLPRVAPGRFLLKRMIPNHAPGRLWHVALASLDIQPGQTYDLHLGQGASVTGQLLIPPAKPWMIRQARLEPKGQPHTEGFENLAIDDDGRFTASDLQPGAYSLHVALHEFPPGNDCGWGRIVGEYDKDLTIANPTGVTDLGTLTPKPITPSDLKPGDAAPDLAVQTLDGKSLRLADLKGKVVLLDFWATWCAPCVAELPNLRAIHAAHRADPNFVLLSLSLDDQDEEFRSYIKRASIPWPQSRVGVDSPQVTAYGATAIPATFLIGPDGHILARDLRGEPLKNAVTAALSKHSE